MSDLLSIYLINGESSGPRVYSSVSELVEFPKHSSRLGSFNTSWLDSRASVFGHADTWKSPELNVFVERGCVMLSVWNDLFCGDSGQFG